MSSTSYSRTVNFNFATSTACFFHDSRNMDGMVHMDIYLYDIKPMSCIPIRILFCFFEGCLERLNSPLNCHADAAKLGFQIVRSIGLGCSATEQQTTNAVASVASAGRNRNRPKKRHQRDSKVNSK